MRWRREAAIFYDFWSNACGRSRSNTAGKSKVPIGYALAHMTTGQFTPPPGGPERHLDCPSCHVRLTFVRSMLNTAAPPERWDEFVCQTCGAGFDYRRRTGDLQRF